MDINLKKIRKDKGLTMQSVADISNLDPCRICMVEKRPQDRTIKMVEKVANALGYELTLKKKDED